MIEDFYNLEPYCLDSTAKKELLTSELLALTEHHRKACMPYASFLEGVGFDPGAVSGPEDIPFFPVSLFKECDLLSVPREDVFKTMTSSGTTGQRVSKIFVDRETAMIQQKVLLKILGDFWGKKRLPMLIIDNQKVLKDGVTFTARGAAIQGLRIAAREMCFVLDEDMHLDLDALRAFLDKHGNERFVVFGFTFMVWKHLFEELNSLDERFDMSNAYLMTGGGWKKLESESLSRADFKREMNRICGIAHFLDHYAMVEQTGCIYAECEYGRLHASIYSDVFIRRPNDFSLCEMGERGIIQVVSALPHSYPGHALLTEDEGVVLGEDDCPCGRKGKYIEIFGRLKSAELRGCSDTYAAGVA